MLENAKKIIKALVHLYEKNNVSVSYNSTEIINLDKNELLKVFLELKSKNVFDEITKLLFSNNLLNKDTLDQIEDYLNKDETKHIISISDNKNDLVYTEEQILQFEKEWINLYEEIDVDKLPRWDKDNIFFIETLIKRFIDSKAADFVFETHQNNWEIYYRISYKFSKWQIDEVIKTNPWDKDLNDFIDRCRFNLVSSKAWKEPNKKNTSQNSWFSFKYKWRLIRFRFSAWPVRINWVSYHRIVIRYTSNWDEINLSNLWIRPFMQKKLENFASLKSRLNIQTGPTWSWKSTTMYWILNLIDKLKYYIFTIEKPIESALSGISQSEIDDKEKSKEDKYEFDDARRLLTRQALDYIVIWEMQDAYQLKVWTTTALQWNPTLWTMHADNATWALIRYDEEWISRSTIASAITNISWQRLPSQVCPHCAIKSENTDRIIDNIKRKFYRSKKIFRENFKTFLEWLWDKVLDVDEFLTSLERDNDMLMTEDKKLLLSLIYDNKDNITSFKEKQKVIDFLLKLTVKYPQPEVHDEYEKALENPIIYEENSDWCEKCGYTGKSRKLCWIYEVFQIDRLVKKYLLDKSKDLNDLHDYLLDRGYIDMFLYWSLFVLEWKLCPNELNNIIEN